MDSFGIQNMEALQSLINGDQDEDENEHVYGSALTPGTMGGKEKSELAKPNAEVVVKTFNRDAKGGATEESLKQQREEQK